VIWETRVLATKKKENRKKENKYIQVRKTPAIYKLQGFFVLI